MAAGCAFAHAFSAPGTPVVPRHLRGAATFVQEDQFSPDRSGWFLPTRDGAGVDPLRCPARQRGATFFSRSPPLAKQNPQAPDTDAQLLPHFRRELTARPTRASGRTLHPPRPQPPDLVVLDFCFTDFEEAKGNLHDSGRVILNQEPSPGEVLRIRKEDVDLEAKTLKIREEGPSRETYIEVARRELENTSSSNVR